MATPSLSTLTLIKWTDREGKHSSLKITELISAKWNKVGIMLGQQMSTLDNISQKSDDNIDRCLRVFSHWIEAQGSPRYSLTWEGLLELLRDIDHSSAAKKLSDALKIIKKK